MELVRGKNDLHEELMLQAVSTVKLETKYLSEHIASGKKDDSRYELCSSDDNSNRMNEVLTAIYKHLFESDNKEYYIFIRTIQDLQVLLDILSIKAKASFINGENDKSLRILHNILQLYDCMEDRVANSMNLMQRDLNCILKKHLDSLHESNSFNLQWPNRYHHITELINKAFCLYSEIRLHEGELISASNILKRIIAIEECSPSVQSLHLYIKALVRFNISISGSNRNLTTILSDAWNLHQRIVTSIDAGMKASYYKITFS